MYAVMIIHDEGEEYVAAICQDEYAAIFIASAYNKNNETMQNPVRYEVVNLQKTGY